PRAEGSRGSDNWFIGVVRSNRCPLRTPRPWRPQPTRCRRFGLGPRAPSTSTSYPTRASAPVASIDGADSSCATVLVGARRLGFLRPSCELAGREFASCSFANPVVAAPESCRRCFHRPTSGRAPLLATALDEDRPPPLRIRAVDRESILGTIVA